MSVRFVLAPQAALDLVEIWRYIKEQTSLTIADRVEFAIREKIEFLALGERHLNLKGVVPTSTDLARISGTSLSLVAICLQLASN